MKVFVLEYNRVLTRAHLQPKQESKLPDVFNPISPVSIRIAAARESPVCKVKHRGVNGLAPGNVAVYLDAFSRAQSNASLLPAAPNQSRQYQWRSTGIPSSCSPKLWSNVTALMPPLHRHRPDATAPPPPPYRHPLPSDKLSQRPTASALPPPYHHQSHCRSRWYLFLRVPVAWINTGRAAAGPPFPGDCSRQEIRAANLTRTKMRFARSGAVRSEGVTRSLDIISSPSGVRGVGLSPGS